MDFDWQQIAGATEALYRPVNSSTGFKAVAIQCYAKR